MVFSSNQILNRSQNVSNCNLSQRLVELTLLFVHDVEEHEFPSNCTYTFIEELAVLKYKYIHKGKYSIVQNKQKRGKNTNMLQLDTEMVCARSPTQLRVRPDVHR